MKAKGIVWQYKNSPERGMTWAAEITTVNLKKLKAKVKYIPLQGNYLLVNEDDLIKFLDNDSHLVEKHVSPPPKFEDGVVYALARLIDLFDEPVIAYGVLHESGIDLSKIKSDDAKILRKAGKQKVKS